MLVWELQALCGFAVLLKYNHNHTAKMCVDKSARGLAYHKKREINSLDFVINQFFMKLFCTSDINIVREGQQMFQFKIPSEQLAQRRDKFMQSFHDVCDV